MAAAVAAAAVDAAAVAGNVQQRYQRERALLTGCPFSFLALLREARLAGGASPVPMLPCFLSTSGEGDRRRWEGALPAPMASFRRLRRRPVDPHPPDSFLRKDALRGGRRQRLSLQPHGPCGRLPFRAFAPVGPPRHGGLPDAGGAPERGVLSADLAVRPPVGREILDLERLGSSDLRRRLRPALAGARAGIESVVGPSGRADLHDVRLHLRARAGGPRELCVGVPLDPCAAVEAGALPGGTHAPARPGALRRSRAAVLGRSSPVRLLRGTPGLQPPRSFRRPPIGGTPESGRSGTPGRRLAGAGTRLVRSSALPDPGTRGADASGRRGQLLVLPGLFPEPHPTR